MVVKILVTHKLSNHDVNGHYYNRIRVSTAANLLDSQQFTRNLQTNILITDVE